MRKRALFTVALSLFAAACAGYGQPIEPLEVFVIDIQPLDGGNFEQRFRIDLRILNPNDFDLEIDGLDFQLDVNGVRLTRGVSNQEIALPRLTEGVVTVMATTTLFDLLRQLVSASETEELSYEIRGRVFLANSLRRVEFERSGTLSR